jgi:hypothetical protein
MTINIKKEELNQILHSIFEEQNFKQMDWQKVPSEFKKATDIFDNLSLDEVLLSLTVSRWPFDYNKTQKADLSNYSIEVQKCLERSNNYLLYNEQFETLFCLAGGKKEDALKFRRDWNKKYPEVRNELANQMTIEGQSLKTIILTLSYDQENNFACSENYELANDFLNTVRSYSMDPTIASKLLGRGIIHYLGDSFSEKRPDITVDLRSILNLRIQDEENLWVEFMLEKDGIQTTHQYNLLEPMKIQNDIYFMDPSFYKIRDTNCFVFSSQIVWLTDEEPEHFEFSVRYFGDLHKYLNVGEMY